MSKTIYDNTNLAESYAGTTTPLTYSFVRSVYADAYRHFSRMMGVSERTIACEHELYEHMIAMIGGRLYYRLDLWYRLVSLLPGYRFNKQFFENMLGVPRDRSTEGDRGSWRYLPGTLWQAIVIAVNFFIMGISVRKFVTRFHRQYDAYATKDLRDHTLSELNNLYEKLCTELLGEWRVPIANDFAVMVSTGLLGVMGKGFSEVDIYGALVQDVRTPLVSLDPGRRISAIAEKIIAHPRLYEVCAGDTPAGDVMRTLRDTHEYEPVVTMIDAYIAELGSRAPNELKLESETFTERPEAIIGLLRSSFHKEVRSVDAVATFDPRGLSLLRRMMFAFLLRWARAGIARREETRLCRSLIFGLARRIFLTAGERLHAAGVITHPRDVFFLSVNEIFAEHGDKVSLRVAIEERKGSLADWKTCDLPSRIESERSTQEIERDMCASDASPPKRNPTPGILQGRVASTGGIRGVNGYALVLRTFDAHASFAGKILVTTHTDPGWTIVFPLVAAIIVEHGGMLSHAAIVARELGIPCIVGVTGATSAITDGAAIRLDLSSGAVHITGNTIS